MVFQRFSENTLTPLVGDGREESNERLLDSGHELTNERLLDSGHELTSWHGWDWRQVLTLKWHMAC